MRRNGTDIMAIGAILAGAAIGAGGTLALVGDSLDARSATAWNCESVFVTAGSVRSVRIYTEDSDGEVRRKKCPRTITRRVYVHRPARTVDMALQARLEATARALDEARTRQEVILALEKGHAEAAEAAAAAEAAQAAQAAPDGTR